MKIGDMFTDGGRKYKAIGFDADGRCISTADFEEKSQKNDSITPVIEGNKAEEDNKYTKTDIKRMSKENLEALCVELGLPVLETSADMKTAILEKLAL